MAGDTTNDSEPTQADLTQWGSDTKPRCRRLTSLELGYRTVGFIAQEINSGRKVYVSNRNTEDHRYHGADPWYDLSFMGDGYGLSLELFKQLHGRDIGIVYIVEEDTRDVLQYAFSQFVAGDIINTDDEADERGYEKDPQAVVPVADAVAVWEGHAPYFWVKQPAYE